MNILLVDDDPFLQCLYRKTLEREGYALLTANDGLAAIEKLSELSPDLVVLDLMLPKLDGLQVLETIRSKSLYKDLPVLILSNAYLPQVAQKAMKAGATAGILKSECSPKRLVKMIRDVLKVAPTVPAKDNEQPTRSSWISGLLGRKPENSDEAHAKVTETSAGEPESEPAGSSEVQDDLLKSWPTDVSMIRTVCLKYAKLTDSPESAEQLREIYRRLRLLSARATMAEWSRISELSSALEAMLFERGFNSSKVMSQSAIQTMLQAVDCLEHLFKSGRTLPVKSLQKTRILLVDDDPVCNRANELALKRVNFDTVCASDGVAALALLESGSIDLVLLDINMPVLGGWEVCEKLRKLPRCKETRVIFVTMQDDLKSRAQSILSGGNGLIAKPISPLELIVKTLIFLFHTRSTGKDNQKGLPANPPPVNKNAAGSPAQSQLAGQPKSDGRGKESPASQTTAQAPTIPAGSPQARTAEKEQRADNAGQPAAAQIKLPGEPLRLAMKPEEPKVETTPALKPDGQAKALPPVQVASAKESKEPKAPAPAAETKPPQTAEQEAAACIKRMGDLESALAALQQAKENLTREIKTTDNDKRRSEIEKELVENQKKHAALTQEMEATWLEFETQQQTTAQPYIQVRTKEASPVNVEDKVRELTVALAAETERCESVMQQATHIRQQRNAMETELVTSNLAQAQLRAELAEQRQLLDTLTQAYKVEVGNLSKELGGNQATVEKVNALTLALATERKQCERAEQQAGVFSEQRKVLEAELAASKEAQEKLRVQLAEQQQILNGKAHNSSDRVKELEASQTAAEEKIKSLTQALAMETKRGESAERQAAGIGQSRKELVAELDASKKVQEQLRAQLAEQQKFLDDELDILAKQTKKLEADRVVAEEKIKSLTQALAEATKRCESTGQQAAGISQQRKAMEAELAASKQTQEKLRAQLAEQQQLLKAQAETHKVEVGDLTGRAKEFEASRAALEEKIKSLTQALAVETKRCETTGQQAASIGQQREAVEAELAASKQTQEKLRVQLAEQQQLLKAQAETHKVEVGNLTGRAREFETSRAALEEKIKSLTQALAVETKRCESTGQQAVGISEQRKALEAELAKSEQAQEKLRAQLAEQQQLLKAQAETHKVEVGNLTGRAREFETSRAALEEKIKSLTQALAVETKRCESTWQQAADLSQQKKAVETELAASHQARAQLDERARELEISRAAAEEKLNSLTQALAVATKRCDSAERQAAYLSQQKKALETELAAGNQMQAQLRAQMQEQRQLSDAQVGDLIEQAKELEASRAEVEEKVKSLTKALAAETKRCEGAEQHSAKINQQRNALEAELAASKQVQETLRTQLAEQQQLLKAQIEAHKTEVGNLAGRATELEAGRAALEEKIKSLAQALAAETKQSESAGRQAADLSQQKKALEAELAAGNQRQATLVDRARELEASRAVAEEKIKSLAQALAAETKRCENAEQQSVDISQQRNALEAELAASKQAQTELGAQLTEQQQLVSLTTAELEGFRKCASVEAARQEQLLAKLEKARAELDHQLQAAQSLLATREAAIGGLEAKLQQQRDAQERLEKLFHGEVAQRHQAESQIKIVQAQLDETAGHLAQKSAAEQAWLGLESKLQGCIRSQQDDLAQSRAKLASQGTEIQDARKKVEDLQTRQTALCQKIQDLTEEGKSAAKAIQELSARAAQSENEVEHGRKELAGVRYAILDTSRMSAQLHRERSQQERQFIEGARQLLSSLAQTPLSLAQRKLLGEVQNALDGQKNRQASGTQIASCPVEMPGFRSSEFCFAEVAESVSGCVRVAADAAGVAAKVSTSGLTTARVIGYAEHIHQLVTLLAVSPLTMAKGVNALDLQMAIEPGDEKQAAMNLRMAFSTDNAQELLARLTSVTTSANGLQTDTFNEAELGLAAGWELARALGATVGLELAGSKEACVVLSLPLELGSSSPADEAVVVEPAEAVVEPEPALNSNGPVNGHGRKAKGKHQRELVQA